MRVTRALLVAAHPDDEVLGAGGQRALKSRMLGCFITQAGMLWSFGISHERCRLAPPYHFTRPPHAGCLWYENLDWGMDGRRWRMHSEVGLRELGIEEPL